MSGRTHNSLAWSLPLQPQKGVELGLHVYVDPAAGGSWMPVREDQAEQTRLMLAFAPLHRLALGVAGGVVLGGLLAALTIITVLKGGFPQPNLGLLAQFFWGYSLTWRGVLVGLLWGFGVGFAMGWGFALVRNAAVWIWLTVIRSRAEMEQYSDFLDHL